MNSSASHNLAIAYFKRTNIGYPVAIIYNNLMKCFDYHLAAALHIEHNLM